MSDRDYYDVDAKPSHLEQYELAEKERELIALSAILSSSEPLTYQEIFREIPTDYHPEKAQRLKDGLKSKGIIQTGTRKSRKGKQETSRSAFQNRDERTRGRNPVTLDIDYEWLTGSLSKAGKIDTSVQEKEVRAAVESLYNTSVIRNVLSPEAEMFPINGEKFSLKELIYEEDVPFEDVRTLYSLYLYNLPIAVTFITVLDYDAQISLLNHQGVRAKINAAVEDSLIVQEALERDFKVEFEIEEKAFSSEELELLRDLLGSPSERAKKNIADSAETIIPSWLSVRIEKLLRKAEDNYKAHRKDIEERFPIAIAPAPIDKSVQQIVKEETKIAEQVSS